MENFYLILVVVLFALAVSDLIVGVSNDAVNFLNASFGSKSAPKWVIFSVAALGILVGVTFSSGMMEVARKGIFHPDMFAFSEIMVIFLAVMIADVLLLDIFNTFGLPTSTTVSLVFDLLGAAMAVALVKLQKMGGSMFDIYQYINTEKALAIISGILVSVVIAFTVGVLLQWLTRIIFTFQYQKKIKYLGSIYGGFSFVVLTYFILLGTKGASWLTVESVEWVKSNMGVILIFSFIFWTLLLQVIQFAWKKFDVLVVIVLAGTFSLALAFAGNDLVNFIGVPLAGFESFKAWKGAGTTDPNLFGMGILNNPVKTDTWMLLAAGFIMAVTMVTSGKARTVIATTVDLSRQSEGEERFGSSAASRAIVRGSILTAKRIGVVASPGIKNWIDSRFKQHDYETNVPENPSFDKIRAASNLVVSSILIIMGTNLKLPLSTTYVTFMVAMGTSLADRAWDRESAVYRVSGVFTVIGGWFLTAIAAFTTAAVMALLISLGGKVMFFVLGAFAIFTVIRSHAIHRKRVAEKVEAEEFPEPTVKAERILLKTTQDTSNAIITISKAYFLGLESFYRENRKQLGEIDAEIEEFNQRARKLKANIHKIIQKLQQDSIETGHYYVQIVDYLREMAHSIKYIVQPMFEHLKNNHKPFSHEQHDDINIFGAHVSDFLNYALHIIKESKFEHLDELIAKRQNILNEMLELERKQIRRIKRKEINSKNSVLFFNMMSETKNLLLQTVNLLKATRDFVQYTRS
jgi:phosphate/sulfate permease